jgi:hypothetical protein
MLKYVHICFYNMWCIMAQVVSCQSLTAVPGFTPDSLHVGFVVDKVAMGRVFLWLLWFSPVSVILPWLTMYLLGDEQQARPVGGRCSETSSHPTDTNNNIMVRYSGGLWRSEQVASGPIKSIAPPPHANINTFTARHLYGCLYLNARGFKGVL